MPRLTLPNNVSLHTARNFLEMNSPFEESQDPGEGVLEFHPRWAHLEPVGLAMASASRVVSPSCGAGPPRGAVGAAGTAGEFELRTWTVTRATPPG